VLNAVTLSSANGHKKIPDNNVVGKSSATSMVDRWKDCSGTKSCRFDEPNLIAAGGEFTSLITLNDHTAAGLDAYHSGTDPAEGG
jgi:hypothetical protein